ncbi:ribosome assembly protein 4, putative [Plasmodium berghei]|uniref:Ribosome assembly protein 4, putative n=2 Tax=Plasmodium berghei TaxID=5821 RepID=A0A509AL72_PLABA|nr:ribosome assembly protein 4, putative [Plasmodium berghei ANKA]CXI39567.1 ribosome assembly protein 4, putative [Plasmodium berghei]SCM21725.1 ribosome assembly protein 4, putative [Plasmodium berghei]SCN24984.1 ribosome assembly protein 4, putative [Plasmodium berghei]VUC55571.1 ribosome assembly protein 4, putative [Plasmodium berghei ANKA]|eukprot:XP_034421381.1 ribosome assembly protein 4, putative [Plasmodium berghei ANKA]
MENDINTLTKEILIQFVNHENKSTGPVINVPLSITKDNLDELINDLKKKSDNFIEDDSEDVNYSFMINDKLPLKNNLYESIKNNNISSEDILSIKYFPLNIFKVKKINNCNSTLPGHTNSILCLAFSPNSSHLATGSGDNTVRLWDINSQTPIATLKDHTDWVLSVLFSPDNKFLATTGMDKNVCIYDTHTGKLLNILTGHKKEVTTLCFEPLHLLKETNIKKNIPEKKKQKKEQHEAPNDKNNKIKNGNEEESNINENKNLVNVTNPFPDNNPPEQSGEIREENENKSKIDKMKKRKKTEIPDENESETIIETKSKDCYYINSRLASAGKDGSIRINNILSNSVDKILTGHTNTITCILWSGINEKNSRIYSSSRDTTIKIWNVYNSTLIYDFKGHKHWVNTLSINSERILKNGIYNLDTIINKTDIENHINKSKNIYNNFLKNQNHEKLVSGSDDGTLHLIECLKNDKYKTTKLLGHQKPVIHTQFSPNGKFIASSSFDKSIRIWSGIDGAYLAVFRGHVGPAYKIAWSIDNNYIISCSQDSTLKLWRINHLVPLLKKKEENDEQTKNEQESEQENEHKNEDYAKKTNSKDNDHANNQEDGEEKKKKKKKEKNDKIKSKIKTLLVDLPGHSDAVYAIDWSNDGKFVASGGKDKVLKIWSH